MLEGWKYTSGTRVIQKLFLTLKVHLFLIGHKEYHHELERKIRALSADFVLNSQPLIGLVQEHKSAYLLSIEPVRNNRLHCMMRVSQGAQQLGSLLRKLLESFLPIS